MGGIYEAASKGEDTMRAKSLASLALALAVISISANAPTLDGLTAAGLSGIGVLVATIILMITEALPLPITMLSMMSAAFLLGVASFSDICASFGNSAVFFMLASFGVSAGLMNTNIPQAFVERVVDWSRGKSKRLVAGFLAASAITSSFMSDVPTCVIFGAFAAKLLEASGHDKPGESSLGRSLMIAVPAGAILGGFATPAGNGLNIMVMNSVNQMANANLTFVKWCAAGIPLMAAMATICTLVILRMFKPHNISVEVIRIAEQKTEGSTKLGKKDLKFAVIMFVMIALWISSSWVPQINITVVAVLGVLAMHLPGVDLLKGKDFVLGVSWESIIMCGGIIAIGTVVQSTGAISWLVDLALTGSSIWPTAALLFVFSLIPCLIHLATPVAGAIYALSCIPLITAAMALGIDPCIAALFAGLWICVVFMQPFDLVYLLTYSYGYYTSKDLIAFGAIPTVVLLALSVIWIPAICAVL